MIARTASTPDELAWREQWKANIAKQARSIVPRWLAGEEVAPERATGENPRLPQTPRRRDTGPVLDQTVMLPAASLLAQAVDVRNTRDLVSAAVRWFYTQYTFLPTTVELHPLRCLAIAEPSAHFALDDGCADLGCYTIEVRQGRGVPTDVVRLLGRRCVWENEVEDYYL